jgi:hypothetical protein
LHHHWSNFQNHHKTVFFFAFLYHGLTPVAINISPRCGFVYEFGGGLD